MKRVVSSLSFVLLATATALRAQNPMTAEVTAVYKGVSANILKAAEKMPEADYAFKPPPEVRTLDNSLRTSPTHRWRCVA